MNDLLVYDNDVNKIVTVHISVNNYYIEQFRFTMETTKINNYLIYQHTLCILGVNQFLIFH